MKIISTLLTITALAFTGCVTGPDGKQHIDTRWNATGSLVLKKAASIAESVILNAAVSQFDATNKASFLDSVATGLRSHESELLTGDDIAAIVKVWSPDKPHWENLAGQLAGVYADALKTHSKAEAASIVEAISQGLQKAASEPVATSVP